MKIRTIRFLISILLITTNLLAYSSDYYWIGGKGKWSDINHWATSSGGTTLHIQVPTPFDNVYFDQNSFLNQGDTVTVNINGTCKDMVWNGVLNSPTIICGTSLSIFGSLRLDSKMNCLLYSTYFESTNTGQTIKTNGKQLHNIYFQGKGGGWTLLDSLNAYYINFNEGTLNTGGYSIDCDKFLSIVQSNRILTLDASIIRVTDWEINGQNLVLNSSSSTINCDSGFTNQNGLLKKFNVVRAKEIYTINTSIYIKDAEADIIQTGIGTTTIDKATSSQISNYGTGIYIGELISSVKLDIHGSNNNIDRAVIDGDLAIYAGGNVIKHGILKGNGLITGSNRFDTLILSPGKIYQLDSGETQTIDSLYAVGACTGSIIIRSMEFGGQAIISKSTGSVKGEYLILRDIKATGGATYIANNSIDLGNNSGWNINQPLSKNLYWVGGNGNWSDSLHWSITSGGTAGACLPTPMDNVYFDANSFSSMGDTVNVNLDAYCHDMIWNGVSNTPTFACSTGLSIYGSLRLDAKMNCNLNTTYFESTITGKTIKTSGNLLGNIYFQGYGGGWTLLDSLNADNIYFTKGGLNTGGYTLQCNEFKSYGTNQRVLTLDTSTIKVNGWEIFGQNLVLNASASTIICNSSFENSDGLLKNYNVVKSKDINTANTSLYIKDAIGEITQSGVGTTSIDKAISSLLRNDGSGIFIGELTSPENLDIYLSNNIIDKALIMGYLSVHNGGNVIKHGELMGDGLISGSNRFDTLILSPGKVYQLESGDTQTVDSIKAVGSCLGSITIRSITSGGQAIINKSTGIVTAEYLILRDIKATGGATYIANNSIDLGNNSGWNINQPSSKNLYWVGGEGNWSDSLHWSITSGGTAGACLPTPFDNVYFDANSFSSTGDTVNVNLDAYCRDMVWNGVLYSPTIICSTRLSIYGSLSLVSPMNCYIHDTYFESTDTGQTIRTGGHRLRDIHFQGKGGGWNLSDELVANDIYFNYGIFNTSGFSINCFQFLSIETNNRVLIIDSSTIRVRNWEINGNKLVLNASASTIICNSNFENRDGLLKNYNIVIAGVIYTGNTSIYISDATAEIIQSGSGITTIDKAVSNRIRNDGTGIFISELTSFGKLEIYKSNNNIGKAIINGDLEIRDGGNVIEHGILNGNGFIIGNNRFDTLILSPGKVYRIQSGRTLTISDSFKIRGNNCFPITLSSTFPGAQATISKPSGTVLGDFILMRDIKAIGGATFYAGKYSTDLSNNSGWIYSNGPGYIYGLGQDTGICERGKFKISTANFNGGVSFLWQDGSTKPYFITAKLGTFWVRVDYGGQCYVSDTIKIDTIYPSPTSSFTINDSNQCLHSNSFKFSNHSHISYGPLSYKWDFGDGNYSNLDSLTYNYSFPDTFNVKLIAITNKSCKDTFSRNIYVISPLVDFTINDSTQCITGNNFVYTNTSVSDSGSYTSTWYLGDGSTSNQTNTTNSYNTTDTFSIKLVITSSRGCIDSIIKNIYVNPIPTAGFNINDTDQCFGMNSFIFSNQSQISNGNLNFKWLFGDGDSSTLDSVVHIYSDSGYFDVTLFVISDQGCKDSLTKTILVYPKPNASFTIQDSFQSLKNNNFIFTNNSSTSIGSLNYRWDFGDGNTSTQIHTSHSYIFPDTFQVTLFAISDKDCIDSIIKNVYLKPTTVANFTINKDSQCFNVNNFILTSISFSPDSIISHNWDLNNDGIFNDAFTNIVNYTFNDTGTFSFGLFIISSIGDTDSVSRQVVVLPSPIADFSSSIVCQSKPTDFINSSSSIASNPIVKYYWDFESDGIIDDSINKNLSHFYPVPGNYTTSLKVEALNGCDDIMQKQVIVSQGASADFDVEDACFGDTTIFINKSTSSFDSIINYLWDFGDGRSGIIWGNPGHYYSNVGTYLVSLRVLTMIGCNDSISKNITIQQKPKINLTINGDTVIYKGQSTEINLIGTFDSILWSTGDTINSIVVTDSGIYEVFVTDSTGCMNSKSVRIILQEANSFVATNTITPNGDKINDVWKIFDIDAYSPCHVNIFNRWGDEIYSSSDYKNDWEGTYKGNNVAEGTYYYFVKAKDGSIYKGFVNVLR